MGKKVLVADDEANILMVIEARLKSEGLDVETAANGEEAVEKAKTCNADLIILDMNMPIMNGLKALTAIRGLPNGGRTPIIMLTAVGDTDSIMKAQELKATDYVIKPFDAEEFLEVINRYI